MNPLAPSPPKRNPASSAWHFLAMTLLPTVAIAFLVGHSLDSDWSLPWGDVWSPSATIWSALLLVSLFYCYVHLKVVQAGNSNERWKRVSVGLLGGQSTQLGLIGLMLTAGKGELARANRIMGAAFALFALLNLVFVIRELVRRSDGPQAEHASAPLPAR